MMRIAASLAFVLASGSALLSQDKEKEAEGKKGGSGVDLKDVNLHDLTLVVQRITKKTFLWTEDLNLRQKRVHFVSDNPVVDDPEVLFKAYQSILQVADLMLYPAGKEGQEIYKLSLTQQGFKRPVPLRREEKEPEDRFVTRIFTLQFVSPREVQAALLNMASFPQAILSIESAGLLLMTDYDYNIRRFEEIIKAMDVKKPDVELKLIPLKNAIATEVEQMINGLVQTLVQRAMQARVPGVAPGMGGGQESVKVVADKRTNSVVLLAEPVRMVQIEEIVRRLDSETPFETSGIYIYHLRHTNAKDIAETLTKMYGSGGSGYASGGLRPGQAVGPQSQPGVAQPTVGSYSSYGSGTGYGRTGSEPTIVEDARSNSVIVVTDRNTYKTLEGIIKRLDLRRPQVLIKATVVEVRSSQDFDLGMELARLEDPKDKTTVAGRTAFGLSSIQIDPTTGIPAIVPDVSTPGILLLAVKQKYGNIPAMLKALKGKARISILDEPEAATNDNGLAEMKVKTDVPVASTTFTGAVGYASESFKYETAETLLKISPHISEGGYLRLETTVKIEKFSRESPDLKVPPTRASREITTKEIMIPNGGTMVIGGIVTQDKSESVDGVPILSEVPLIGWLFRREQKNDERRTLYIFLTPYILYDLNFGDYRELTRERKADIEVLLKEELKKLSVDARADKLPESTFRYQAPASARKEE
jgi:general secretion pathway protein D